MIIGTPGTKNLVRGKKTRFTCHKGTHPFMPFFKVRWPYDELEYTIIFHENCLHDEHPGHAAGQPDNKCDGDWNKLIYIGAFEPHGNDGANFGWRVVRRNGRKEIDLCWRCHFNGWEAHYHYPDAMDVRELTPRNGIAMRNIKIGKPYRLKVKNTDNGVKWWLDGELVHRYPYKLDIGQRSILSKKQTWLSSPWYGGGPGILKGCTSLQRMNFTVEFITKIN